MIILPSYRHYKFILARLAIFTISTIMMYNSIYTNILRKIIFVHFFSDTPIEIHFEKHFKKSILSKYR